MSSSQSDLSNWEGSSTLSFDTSAQGSSKWLKLRERFATTGSNFGAIIDYMEGKLDPSRLPAGAIKRLNSSIYACAPLTIPSFSDYAKKIMKKGNELEPSIRYWFAQSVHCPSEANIIEAGLAFNSKYPCIACSSDGLVIANGQIVAIIEIKTTESLDFHRDKGIREAEKYNRKFEAGKDCPIPQANYAQIQGNLAIVEVPTCYYIVYGRSDNKIRVATIGFDQAYWEETAWPALKKFAQLTNWKEQDDSGKESS